MSLIIKTFDQEVEVDFNQNETLIELARTKGIFITSGCGEKGKCGQCQVSLIEGQFALNNKIIEASKNNPRRVLACQTKLKSRDAVIEIPKRSLILLKGRIIDSFTLKHYELDPPTKKISLHIPRAVLESQESDLKRMEQEIRRQTSIKNFHIPLDSLRRLPDALEEGDQTITVTLSRLNEEWSMINIQPGKDAQAVYGIALDIGTTTVVGGLVDMVKGELMGRVSLYNQQINYAEDVISRISLIKSHKELDLLRSLVIDKTVNPIIKHLSHVHYVRRDDISRIALSGNTIMIHLLLGLNPKSIGEVPFQPVAKSPNAFLAKDVGLEIFSEGIVDVIPSVSGYIGGDVASDIYVSKLYEEEGLAVLIDVGTNGEIVISDHGRMKACSTAAGPAFEGYGLYHGSRAIYGAIEKVVFDEENKFRIKIIDDDRASGICGTGVIDFMAEGLRVGLINQMGRLNDGKLNKYQLGTQIKQNGRGVKACIIADHEHSMLNEPVVITESDISKVLEAKAAIYAALKILLQTQGKSWRDIDKLILAGGFGKHINFKNAASIGLLPPIPEDRVEVIGNGSLGGAFLALAESDVVCKMKKILSKVEVIELNMQKDFQQYFIDALFLPNRNKEEFHSENND